MDIVCGAPNVRPGLKVPLILAGHKLPNGFEIKKSKIRGVVSNGMICSERELGISEEATGIMELKAEAVPGVPFSEAHFDADPLFEIAVLSNRPDCLSIIGLARELNVRLAGGLVQPKPAVREGGVAVASKVKVSIRDAAACPRYTARYLRNAKITPSPAWLVKRLASVGIRSINNVVDITNFVMMEMGQPLHAFDYAKINGGAIDVRQAKANEKFTTLDGVERILLESDLLICDAIRPVALAGVMGGLNSEISETTTDILLESAYFEPVGIRRTSKRLGLTSESSYRFERGVDPENLICALDRASALINELCGAEAAQGVIDVNPGKIKPWTVVLRRDRVNRLLGTKLSTDQIKAALSHIDLRCGDGDEFAVTIPTFRPDLTREADLIEEVCRLIGFQNIETRLRGNISLVRQQSIRDDFRNRLRALFCGLGMDEVVTTSLISPEEASLFHPTHPPIVLMNPLNPETSVLRNDLLVSLLKVVSSNYNRNNEDLALFEIGRIFEKLNDGGLATEHEKAACILTGLRQPLSWNGKKEPWDMYAVRGVAEAIFHQIGDHFIEMLSLKEERGEGLVMQVNGHPFAKIFAVAGTVLKRFDIKGSVFFVEFDLDSLMSLHRKAIRYKSISKFPPADRDLAVVVDKEVDVADMLQTIERESEWLERVRVFDVFAGGGLPVDKKSVAFSMRFRKTDNTLSEKEIGSVHERILNKLKNKYKAILR